MSKCSLQHCVLEHHSSLNVKGQIYHRAELQVKLQLYLF
jgi:hypothetical protein